MKTAITLLIALAVLVAVIAFARPWGSTARGGIFGRRITAFGFRDFTVYSIEDGPSKWEPWLCATLVAAFVGLAFWVVSE